MDDLLQDLIAYAIEKKASDIHFVVQNQKLQIKLRTQNEMLDVYQDIWQPAFFEYLKFISRMDLTSPYVPQSGQFKILLHNHEIFCRFSMLNNHNVQTGVIRMLNTMHAIELNALSLWKEDTHFFNSLVPLRQGLVISVGPTNSGKTTTLHALLHEIAKPRSIKWSALKIPLRLRMILTCSCRLMKVWDLPMMSVLNNCCGMILTLFVLVKQETAIPQRWS